MKKLVGMLTLSFLFLAITPARSEDVPYMEFVKALRAKNYTDLALDYLNMLEKSGPADLKEFIPLERANIRLDQASNTLDAGTRNNLYNQARSEYADFARAKGNTPLGAIAQMEGARILGLQCRSAFSRIRYMDPGAAKNESIRIEAMAVQAMQALEKAGDEIDKQTKAKGLGAKMEKALDAARTQADFELAINHIDQAMCYEPQNDSNKNALAAGKRIERAIKDLDGLSKTDRKGPTGAMARAWLVRAYNEIDQTKEAKQSYDQIANDESPAAEHGRRMARYFYFMMLVGGRNLNPIGLKAADVPKEAQKVGEDWIRSYPSHLNTFEGVSLRFELANALRAHAKELSPKKDNLSNASKALYERAKVLYGELEEGTTEFDSDVRNGKVECMIALSEAYTFDRRNLPGIKDFQTCMQYKEMEGVAITRMYTRLAELERKPDKEKSAAEKKEFEELKNSKTFEAKRQEHLKNAQDLLWHALGLAAKDPKIKAKDIVEARSTLCYLMIENNDLERAAVIGEQTAFSMSDTPGAPRAAQYALEAYAKMIANGTEKGLPKEYINADRVRFQRLVELMEGTWPNDPATDAARHHVGTELYADGNYKKAEEVLGRISNAYKPPSALVSALYWQARACQELMKEAKDDKEKEAYNKRAITALRRVPDLSGDVPADVAQVYVAAKLQLGYILYDAKEWTELERLAGDLAKRVPTMKLPESAKDGMKQAADMLAAYAKFGRANAELAAGQPAKALAMVDEVKLTIAKQLAGQRAKVNEIRKPYGDVEKRAEEAAKTGVELPQADKDKLAELTDKLRPYSGSLQQTSSLYRSLLLCSIRACIMTGNKARAKIEVDDLNKVAAEDHVAVHEYYKQLVGEIRHQIVELKNKKDQAALDKLVGSFVGFLDEIVAKTPSLEKPKPADQFGADIGVLSFLAHSYASLDRPEEHAKAASLWSKIQEPKPAPPKKVDPKDESVYRFARLMTAKELRLGKKFSESRKILEEILTKDWGKGFDVRRELAQTWMDEDKYGAAATKWNEAISAFGAKPDFSNAKVKENYFEAQYQYIYCLYMYAKNIDPKDPKVGSKKPEYILRAAKLILRLETTPPGDMGGEQFKKRYDELLKKEDLLRKAYDEGKKEREKENKSTTTGAAAPDKKNDAAKNDKK
jgi:hypothetical protein